MPTDQTIRSTSGSEHQAPLPPARHKGVSAIVWIIVLLIFAGGFYLVLRKPDASATASKSPRGGGGPVSLVTATAKQGDIGVYLASIGTVTPVCTASITSQVNGIVTAVHYKEGQVVRKGDPLIDVDARPYEASLLQAQGTLERDTNLLAQSKMDLQRYHDAWDRNAIPKQTLVEAQVTLQNAESASTNLGIARAQFEHAIAVLIGTTASSFSMPYKPLSADPPAIPVGIPSQLLERRPDIAASERNMAAANAQIGIATAAYYPNLTLSAQGGFESSALQNLLTTGALDPSSAPEPLSS